MFGIGGWEMLLIGVVALLVFGPKRLPELARTLGKGLAEFRRASSDLRRSIDLDLDPARTSAPDPATQPPAQAGAPADPDSSSPNPDLKPDLKPKPKPQDDAPELGQAATPADAPVAQATAVTGAVPTDPSPATAAEVAPSSAAPSAASSEDPSEAKDRADSGSH